jgi:hypothetical protein
VVFHQPETEEELRLAEEAMSGCPVEAIGKDGPPEQAESKQPMTGAEITSGSTKQ